MATIGEALFAPLVGKSLWKNARCVFVLSTGRTGTSSLTRLMDLSPAVRAFHERRPRMMRQSRAAYYDVYDSTDEYVRLIAKGLARPIGYTRFTARIYCDTSNRYTYLAPALAKALPRARFIHLYRHPGDVVRSGMRRGWYGSHSEDRYRITPRNDDPAHAEWDKWGRLSKICWYWSAVNKFALQFLRTIPSERGFSLRFEDLVEMKWDTCNRLFDFLGVQRPASTSIESTLAMRHNSQRTGEYPAWRDWNRRDRDVLGQIAGDTMVTLGYELYPSEGPALAARR